MTFELVSGAPAAMLALAERWRGRYGLLHDPRSRAERGHALAASGPDAPLRKAALPRYGKRASAMEAFGAVLDECLAHIGRNAIGLATSPANGLEDVDAALRVELVHQLRVGIRRLRSALRVFRGWVAEPPVELVDGLRVLFAALGRARDSDVLASGVGAELALVGAPALPVPGPADAVDPAALIRAGDTQSLLLAWITWRAGLQAEPEPQPASAAEQAPEALGPLKRLARRRLRRWHQRLAADGLAFDTLDEAAVHELRKRVKRQRYAMEFFAPLLQAKAAARDLKPLAAAQRRLGEYNDLVVARDNYRAHVAADPAAWFAVGWLTARIAEARAKARDVLGRLAAVDH